MLIQRNNLSTNAPVRGEDEINNVAGRVISSYLSSKALPQSNAGHCWMQSLRVSHGFSASPLSIRYLSAAADTSFPAVSIPPESAQRRTKRCSEIELVGDCETAVGRNEIVRYASLLQVQVPIRLSSGIVFLMAAFGQGTVCHDRRFDHPESPAFVYLDDMLFIQGSTLTLKANA